MRLISTSFQIQLQKEGLFFTKMTTTWRDSLIMKLQPGMRNQIVLIDSTSPESTLIHSLCLKTTINTEKYKRKKGENPLTNLSSQ